MQRKPKKKKNTFIYFVTKKIENICSERKIEKKKKNNKKN